ncbi:770c5c82-150f-40b1-9532-86049464df9b [Sclerotinia trifoliorum]|uniref:770c5c82-150f-40b1-9532-86049464df9b n=1 Tax=Sclerotinia trifoliorum TaxID=28548 RepID=A0A8H2W3U6_9HELO|nr:770c5c82-150f-40b1-9532-86049464df9b [Sclerotinia trifoliorum]
MVAFPFKTACTRQSTGLFSHPNSMPQPPGAWPRSLSSHNTEMDKETQQNRSSACQECLEEHYKCGTINKTGPCLRCIQTGRECSFSKGPGKDPATSFMSTSEVVDAMYDANTDASSPQQLSQNRRLMQGLIEMAGPHQALSFSSGDAHYGDRLTAVKSEDAEFWVQSSGKLVLAAQAGPAVWKRIFLDLRDIRQANVPFISATTIKNPLDTILASIEGPPETPYEGGIFWITFKIKGHYPDQLPLMRFNTKVYHPNISPQGYVCIDSQPQNYPRRLRSLDKWPSGSDRKLDWSIGALLTALCGLLSSPDVDGPLVPEIAHTYLKNYDEYCSNARLYTKKYASGERPDETNLVFFDISSQEIYTSSKDDDTSSKGVDSSDSLNSHQSKSDSSSDSGSFREFYDEVWV